NACGSATSTAATLTVNTATQAPWGGTARAIPGVLQAEDVDSGGEGVAYHDDSAGNLGGAYRSDDVDVINETGGAGALVIGAFNPGEWIEYTVNVAAAGSYQF